MSSTSPRDLAVTLRSVPRRLHEAVGDVPTGATTGVTAELDEQIRMAAGLMHSAANPAAIADAIDAVPADAWDETTLSKLRSIALDIGRLLRAAAAVAERSEDDDED
jgi:post-segregation antitoxin (ccd killing protein)